MGPIFTAFSDADHDVHPLSSSSSTASYDSEHDGMSDDDIASVKSPNLSHTQGSSAQRNKVKIESSVRLALGAKKAPLLAFFESCSRKEYEANLARDRELMAGDREVDEAREASARKEKLREQREKAKLRQQRLRDRKRGREIDEGIRSPGGTKRKIVEMELTDSGLSKKPRIDAEATRPARLLKWTMKEKTRKPQGRKQKHGARPAKHHNWFTPVCWVMIEQAAKASGWQMSETKIVQIAKARNPEIFAKLSRETVRGWIDRTGPQPRWSDATVRRIAAGNAPGHTNGGKRGALVSMSLIEGKRKTYGFCYKANYPEVVVKIKTRLAALRKSGVPLTVITARGVMIAVIIREAPEIMERVFNDGSTFRASDTFMRRWLHSAMGWSRRKGTRAAQKLPDDWEDQCEKAAIRRAYLMREYDIPAELFANSDQTQRLYAPGDKLTYAETGSKQVSVIGGDEKRAFTVMVTVTSAGVLLPFQAIYVGKTNRSCPNREKAPDFDAAVAAGFRFEFSGTETYWANQKTMQNFVNFILAPYFEAEKVKLGRPPDQCSLWVIDVWSVHRSDEFLTWMRQTHPKILIDFVPGGCTGVAQPCDVGIQRPFKHITNQCFLEDIVASTLAQIDSGTEINIDETLPTLRNASVRWLWTAYNALNKKEIVKKVSD
jgi:hypothetical protein